MMEDHRNKDTAMYSTAEIEKMIQYICVRDEQKALAQLQGLQERLTAAEMPATVRRYHCYEMLVTSQAQPDRSGAGGRGSTAQL